MPNTTCRACGSPVHWTWEDAFAKFGFNDGEGTVMTEEVVTTLENAGYIVDYRRWGLHNTIILSIRKAGRELIPDSAKIGYDNPRSYLPQDIIDLLDRKLPQEEIVS